MPCKFEGLILSIAYFLISQEDEIGGTWGILYDGHHGFANNDFVISAMKGIWVRSLCAVDSAWQSRAASPGFLMGRVRRDLGLKVSVVFATID